MTKLYKNVNGKRVEISDQETQEVRTKWAANAQARLALQDVLDKKKELHGRTIQDQVDSLLLAIINSKNIQELKDSGIVRWRDDIEKKYEV